MTRIFGLLLLMILPVTAWSAEYYVAPNGNDAWSGTLASPNTTKTDGPFATPARAIAAARDGRKPAEAVTIVLRGGRYELREPLTFTPQDSGTRESPLVVAAYPNEVPILSGGRRVEPKVEDGVWIIPVPEARGPIRHLTVNGEMRLPTRFPKTGEFTIRGLAGANPKAHYRTAGTAFEFSEGQIDPTWKNLADIEVVVLHFWVDGHYGIKSIDPKTRIVTLDRPSIRRFTEDGGPKPGRFYLRNVPTPLEPGEFHHDRSAGVIRYRPKPGESTSVVVPRLDTVIRFEGDPGASRFVEHIELRGLTVSDSLRDIGTKSAGDLQAAQHVPGAVRLVGARHCTIRDCRLLGLGGYGLELADGCRNNQIVGNELAHLAAGGIRLSGGAAGTPDARRTGENHITDNHLHDLGLVFHAGVGILSQHADRNRIAHNHIHHLNYTGISVGWVWGYAPSVSAGNIIEANHIHDIGQKVLSDMGGIYMLGISPGTIVRGNHLHDIESFGYGGWGIYTDEGSTGIVIENNLVHHTKSGGFHQHYGRENIVRNNIFALAREGQLMRSRAEPHLSFTLERNIVLAKDAPLLAKNWKDDKFALNHNLYWDLSGKSPAFPAGTFKQWQARGFDTQSIVADPLFVDPEKGDFRFRTKSPAAALGFKPFDTSAAGVRPKDQRTSP